MEQRIDNMENIQTCRSTLRLMSYTMKIVLLLRYKFISNLGFWSELKLLIFPEKLVLELLIFQPILLFSAIFIHNLSKIGENFVTNTQTAVLSGLTF